MIKFKDVVESASAEKLNYIIKILKQKKKNLLQIKIYW